MIKRSDERADTERVRENFIKVLKKTFKKCVDKYRRKC